jgi:hypothetical protein
MSFTHSVCLDRHTIPGKLGQRICVGKNGPCQAPAIALKFEAKIGDFVFDGSNWFSIKRTGAKWNVITRGAKDKREDNDQQEQWEFADRPTSAEACQLLSWG